MILDRDSWWSSLRCLLESQCLLTCETDSVRYLSPESPHVKFAVMFVFSLNWSDVYIWQQTSSEGEEDEGNLRRRGGNWRMEGKHSLAPGREVSILILYFSFSLTLIWCLYLVSMMRKDAWLDHKVYTHILHIQNLHTVIYVRFKDV